MAAIHVMMLLLGLAAWHMESVGAECCNKIAKTYYAESCSQEYPIRATLNQGECKKNWHLCPDCTETTPFCAHGRCNIFGCNCDDGCRTGHGVCYCNAFRNCFKRPASYGSDAQASTTPLVTVHAADVINLADTDQDGRLSFEEARAYLGGNHTDVELQALDGDNDGFLTANEIDRDG